jgi:radical SAM superfamily enzyme YgiQ (UPF0313 family)
MQEQIQKVSVYPVLLLRPWESRAANGSSYPLGCLFSYAKAYKNGSLKSYFDFKQMINRQVEEWGSYREEAAIAPPGIWLFSCYEWNCDDNLQLAKEIKQLSPQSLIVVGGPHIPGYEEESREFFRDHTYIDISARGEGEVTLAEILDRIRQAGSVSLHQDFSEVNGITFRKNNEIIRTPDRIRNRDLDLFPSPYLTGEFDHESFENLPMMVMETNRGCPFGCTFCDWGSATLQKFSLFNTERIKQEIEIIGKKRACLIYIADSNFGVFERDIEITQSIIEVKKKYHYPELCGCNFAKNASTRLAEIIKLMKKSKLMNLGLISLQTSDLEVLSAIRRENIKNEKYEKLIEIFKSENLKLSSELLIGLPGQTVENFKKDLQFFVDRKLTTVVYMTAVMPNAPMNDPEYKEKHKIVINKNGHVISTSTFTEKDREMMVNLSLGFQFFYAIGVLKYYLYYLQIEHSILVMDFIFDLLDESINCPERNPITHRLQRELLVMKSEYSPFISWDSGEAGFIFDHIDDFYNEISIFTQRKYGVILTASEKKTLFCAQKAIMRSTGKALPFSVDLEHDLVAYINQVKDCTVVSHSSNNFKALGSMPPKVLKVSSQKNGKIKSLDFVNYDRHGFSGWELKSDLRF